MKTMKTDRDLQTLIDRYLDGETSPREERQLALAVERRIQILENGETGETGECLETLKALRLMLGELTLGEASYDEVMRKRHSRRFMLRFGWAAAACMTLIAGAGYFLSLQKEPTRQLAEVTTQLTPQPPARTEEHPDAGPQPGTIVQPVRESQGKQKVSHPVRMKQTRPQLASTSSPAEDTKPQEVVMEEKTLAVVHEEEPAETVGDVSLSISPHKQALVDLFLAEEALQVAYELQAQQEVLRAYAASLKGKETPKAIIAF